MICLGYPCLHLGLDIAFLLSYFLCLLAFKYKHVHQVFVLLPLYWKLHLVWYCPFDCFHPLKLKALNFLILTCNRGVTLYMASWSSLAFKKKKSIIFSFLSLPSLLSPLPSPSFPFLVLSISSLVPVFFSWGLFFCRKQP